MCVAHFDTSYCELQVWETVVSDTRCCVFCQKLPKVNKELAEELMTQEVNESDKNKQVRYQVNRFRSVNLCSNHYNTASRSY